MSTEIYGQKLGKPVFGNIYHVLLLKNTRKKVQAGTVLANKYWLELRGDLEEDKESKPEHENNAKEKVEKEYYNDQGDASVSGSVTSSQSSKTSDSNIVKEFKATLYERKYPRAVTLLKYTLWLLIALLLTVSIVEWIITYQKIDDNVNFFNLDAMVTSRLDAVTMLALFSRTTDLILEYAYLFNLQRTRRSYILWER